MYNNLLPKFFLDLNHTHPMKVTKEEEMTDGIDGHAVEVEIGLSSRQSSKPSYKRDTGKVKSHRSRSPSFRSRRQRSYSRSSSRSRSSPYSRSKYSKPKRRYKSRSRSRSYSRRRSKSNSRSRRRRRSRSRSASTKKSVNRSSSSSDSSDTVKIAKPKQKEEKPDDFNINPISIPSDDPILKQQLLDEINNPSFIPKTFKSGRTDDPNFSNAAITNDHITVENPVLLRDTQKPGYRKNETVFHDSLIALQNGVICTIINATFENCKQRDKNKIKTLDITIEVITPVRKPEEKKHENVQSVWPKKEVTSIFVMDATVCQFS
ncbi:hypothetical protein V9T40_004420 [Parthenolecanium corni]|uniref:Uncharacterized protein n=1 Tax=Parthenolecanium corni TaxID=536013 RepID=A0AAN9TSM9_9HEMI